MELSNSFINSLIKVCVSFEVFTAIIGTVFYYKYRDEKILKLFIFLIWYVAINELVGLYLKLNGEINAIIHNIYNLINFTFFLILYRYYIDNYKHKKIIMFMGIVYVLAFIINGFYENYFTEYQRFPYIIGGLSLVISVILYFIDLLNSEKVLKASKDLLFWISVGLLIYFVGNLPFRIIRNYYSQLADATIILLVNITLTFILNICFIIGFICSHKKQPY